MSDFGNRLESLSRKLFQVKDQLETEEATKNGLIMQFISQVLGYNVFDIREVVPEFTADVGTKKGEKVDYAIMKDGAVSMLIECKRIGQELSLNNASQLFRYFHVTSARIAILTNGQVYQFYTDLDTPNKMDERPFLVLDLAEVDPALVPQIAKLAKTEFDLESVLSAAEQLKYISAVKRVMQDQIKEVDQDFLQLFLSRIYSGRITQKVRDELQPSVQSGLNQFISDQVNARLKRALGDDAVVPGISSPLVEAAQDAEATAGDEEADQANDGIETTQEEIQAYRIVQAIVCETMPLERVALRDAKSYCAILVDDNNRKPLCRLYFNRSQWYITLPDEEKNFERFDIDSLRDIYKHKEQLLTIAARYV